VALAKALVACPTFPVVSAPRLKELDINRVRRPGGARRGGYLVVLYTG